MFSRKRAILVGADNYVHGLTPLKYCGNDAGGVAREFRNSLQFRKDDVLEFREGHDASRPERNVILSQMSRFLFEGKVQPDELLIFYFAGHGMIDTSTGKDYLMPVDASKYDFVGTGIAVEHVISLLTRTGCKNIVMFIDACREAYSGARGTTSVGHHSRSALERSGIVTFFACDPHELSYEIGDIGHGSFSHGVLKAIENPACQTVQAIDTFLQENVPTINSRYGIPAQRPFTVISPADKADLAVFYRETSGPPSADLRIANLRELVGNAFTDKDVSYECLGPILSFLKHAERKGNVLDDLDVRRMRHIEELCLQKITDDAFLFLWSAAEKRSPILPPKRL